MGQAPIFGKQDSSGYLARQPGKATNVVGANAGLAIKAGAGVFRGFSVNTVGSSSTFVAYDGTSTSGTKLGTWTTTGQINFSALDIAFTTGLFIVTTGTLSDITVRYI